MTRAAHAATTGRAADAPTTGALYDLMAGSGARAVAVIGLVKNAGKTTVVNALMANVAHRFGLTSLGLDGERTDHLTGLAKPRIAPPKGTLVATTRGSLERSGYSLQILDELPFTTPLGRVVIGIASGEGQVEVSGPTTLAEVRTTVEKLQALGADQVLVDGAINRLGSASPRVTDGVVVATGGMVGDSLGELVELTRAALELLSLPAASPQTLSLVSPGELLSARAIAVDERGRRSTLTVDTVIGEGAAVAREVERRKTRTLFIAGALTQEFVDDFLRVLAPGCSLRVVVRDATVLVLPAGRRRSPARRAQYRGAHPLRVLAVTTNPFRLPQPYNPKVFFNAVVDAIGDRVAVFDVVNGLAHLPARAAADTAGATRSRRDPSFSPRKVTVDSQAR